MKLRLESGGCSPHFPWQKRKEEAMNFIVLFLFEDAKLNEFLIWVNDRETRFVMITEKRL